MSRPSRRRPSPSGTSDAAAGPPPRRGLRSRASGAALLAAALCLSAAPALAQTVAVSNLDEAAAASVGTLAHDNPLWMSFATAGASTDRYVLKSVAVDVASGADDLTVAVWTDSSGDPGAKIGGDLARSGSATSGEVRFDATTARATWTRGASPSCSPSTRVRRRRATSPT